MSEPQTEYETEQETDAEPTPGPWTNGYGGNPEASETCKVKQANVLAGGAVADVNMARPQKENLANARLIAAAGTAAQEAREMGYDAEKVVRALPKILNQIESLLQGEFEYEGVIFPRITDLLRELGGRPLEKDALASAEGSGDE